MSDGSSQFLAGVAAIGKQLDEAGITVPHALDDRRRTGAVLDVSRMHHHFQ